MLETVRDRLRLVVCIRPFGVFLAIFWERRRARSPLNTPVAYALSDEMKIIDLG